ncbi:MAG: hypothetical protein JKY15_05720 [Deltaproteobacteria bacterium]|nr:hypothetical protein [Deltaproteobacteria bacterium]
MPEAFSMHAEQYQEDLHYPEFRLTIDYREDLQLIKEICKTLHHETKE